MHVVALPEQLLQGEVHANYFVNITRELLILLAQEVSEST